ncbi:caspase family protein [Bradyrhizobium lablabi]|uniref:caspase family protein n=1 Tax=Bradyrhizobium lablabi TaxID=722472 RepID=UPI001BA77155|nr:caspase family protein [Bradyrhizobium lablabi]MBR1121411.1 caspase family protein [Bradyrhizobium lablabi]
MRRLATLIVAMLAIGLASRSALADKRVAFVVGNSSYQNVVALANPANDAAAVTDMFKKAAFDVVETRRDLKNSEMRRALRDFTEKARDADIAVIYYAGHGLEVDGTNYLVPVDAVLERDTDAYDEAISLDRILQAIEPAKQLRLVILDACRDNPFAKTMKRMVASRALGRGLAGVEPSRPNTLIAFAAKGGSTAADGDGRHSPFTSALLAHLAKPGLELGKAFRLVRDDVMKATGNRQEPFVYGSLGGNDVSLVPAPAVAAPPVVADPNAGVRRDYELAERVGTREAWDSFIAAHPSGFYTELAKAQRNKLAAEATRVAAAEKARLAAEEQARLAAEGARAAEQAKAAQQAKAAEEAKLAAEKQKRIEEEKVAAAEKAKAAAQAKAEEDARKAAEKKAADDAKLAAKVAEEARKTAEKQQADEARLAAEQARKAEEGRKAEEAKVASLAPQESRTSQPAPPDIPRLLQAELKRVGCKTGDVSSEWNESARKALSSFNNNAGTKLDIKLASIDALDVVKSKTGRVCPLACERGYRASGEQCVKITCDDGYVLGSNGACQKRPPKVTQQRERRAPASGRRGGKCFVANGMSFCE